MENKTNVSFLNEKELQETNGGSVILVVALGLFATGYGMGVQKELNKRR